MKKTLIIFVLLLVGFSNVSNAMSDDTFLLQYKEKLSHILKNSNYWYKYIEDYSLGVWTTQDANLGKEKKFIYLSSSEDLLIYEVNEQNDLILKKHIHGHYGIDDVKEVDYFIPNVSNLSLISITGGTGVEVRYRHILYMMSDEEILSFDYRIFYRASPGMYLGCGGREEDREWCNSIKELMDKEERGIGLDIISNVEALHDYSNGYINFFANFEVNIGDSKVFDQFKKLYNYKGPYKNILVKKIFTGGFGGGRNLYAKIYECGTQGHPRFPFTSGGVLNCIDEKPTRISISGSSSITVNKDRIATIKDEEFYKLINESVSSTIAKVFRNQMLADLREHRDVFYYEDIKGYLGDFNITFNTGSIDLNNDGQDELLIEYVSRMYCGVGGRCGISILEKDKHGWRIKGSFSDHGYGIFVIKDENNEYSQIKTVNKWNEVTVCKYNLDFDFVGEEKLIYNCNTY